MQNTTFYYTFPEYLKYCTKIKSNNIKNVIAWLCMYSEYNTGFISLSAAKRRELCEQLGITSSQLSQYLIQLDYLDVIIGEKGKYQLNPRLFWKGDLTAREDLIKC